MLKRILLRTMTEKDHKDWRGCICEAIDDSKEKPERPSKTSKADTKVAQLKKNEQGSENKTSESVPHDKSMSKIEEEDEEEDEGSSDDSDTSADANGDLSSESNQQDDLCSSLAALGRKLLPDITVVRPLDPVQDNEVYNAASKHFHDNWIKPNATDIRIESILAVVSNQMSSYDSYKAKLAERGLAQERLLYHGTDSCQGHYHYEKCTKAQASVNGTNMTQEEQLCYKMNCATCGILAKGFDITKSGQGSIARGQNR
ncbi:hypothetical protein BGZ94_003479, partial [Podila epigama]